MPGFADSPAGIVLQAVLSLLLIGVTVYSAYGWMDRQDPRDIAPAPITYFLGRFGWKPLLWLAVLLLMLPVYEKYRFSILAATHAIVLTVFWMHRMLVCGQWRQY